MIPNNELLKLRVPKNSALKVPSVNSYSFFELLNTYDDNFSNYQLDVDRMTSVSTFNVKKDLVTYTGSISNNQLSGTFTTSDLGKTVVMLDSSEINYSLTATVANIAARNALTGVTGQYVKVTDSTGDARYPAITGTQIFRYATSTWQLVKRYENISGTITSIVSKDRATISNIPVNPSASFTVYIGTDNRATFQAAIDSCLSSGKTLYVPKGNYLVMLDETYKELLLTRSGGSNFSILGESELTSKIYFFRRSEFTSGSLFVGFSIRGEDATNNLFNVDIKNLTLSGDGLYHKSKESQPTITGIYWFDGQGKLTISNITISSFTNGFLTTGALVASGERLVHFNNVTITDIFSVGFGLFGQQNTLNAYNCKFKNLGTLAVNTIANVEYGQGGYFHRNNSTLFHGCTFENNLSSAITYFSSGSGYTAKYQIISNCLFKDCPNGVSSDDRFHNTQIIGCVFDASPILVGSSVVISDCLFTSRTTIGLSFPGGTSPDKPMFVQVKGCKFQAQSAYSINVQDNTTQAPIILVDNCLFNTEGAVGTNILMTGTGTMIIQNSMFQGASTKTIQTNNTVKVICNNNYFNQTASDKNIKVLDASKFYANDNFFETLSLTASGTGDGELYNSKFFNAPTVTNTNANFKINSKVYTPGQTALQYP